jgi:quinol monooxygenase YgiN
VIIVIARVRLRAERRDEFLGLLLEVQEASRRDDGCLNYAYHVEIGDPERMIAVEEWRDMDALAAHLRTEHVQRLIAAIGEMTEDLEIAAHEVARSGPLPLPA